MDKCKPDEKWVAGDKADKPKNENPTKKDHKNEKPTPVVIQKKDRVLQSLGPAVMGHCVKRCKEDEKWVPHKNLLVRRFQAIVKKPINGDQSQGKCVRKCK